MGAQKLVNDTSMFPIRGQVYRVRCPGLKHAIIGGDNYILPKYFQILILLEIIILFISCSHDGVYVLGGTHQENDWNTNVNPIDSQFIWDGCVKLAPMLKVHF